MSAMCCGHIAAMPVLLHGFAERRCHAGKQGLTMSIPCFSFLINKVRITHVYYQSKHNINRESKVNIHCTFSNQIYKILYKIRKVRLKRDELADRESDCICINSQKSHVISQSNLNTGDFLFCRPRVKANNTNIQSSLIQSVTGGYYTHCALHIGNGKIIHAVSPKVREDSLIDLLKEYDYLVATRLQCIANPSHIISYAQKQLNKPYNLCGAVLSPFFEWKYVVSQHIKDMENPLITNERVLDKKSLFCSQLLMESMFHCGYLDNLQACERYFQSEYWTPTGLAKYGYGDFFTLVGFLSNNQNNNFNQDYFLTNNMGDWDKCY